MQVLLLTPFFPNASDRRHGIFVQRQAEQLREFGCDIVVIVPSPYLPKSLAWVQRWRRYRDRRDAYDAGGFEIHRPSFLRPPGAWFQPFEWLAIYYAARRTAWRLHASRAFDVLYAQDAALGVPAGARIARDLRIPCVGMAIGVDVNQCEQSTTAYRRTVARGLNACDIVVCNSEPLAERAAELTEKRQSVVTITRGVDVDRFCPLGSTDQRTLRRRLRLPESGLLIVYVGYLQRRKGIYELVRAFGRIVNSHPDVHLILVGDGYERQGLIRLTEENCMAKRVQFMGHVDHDQIPYVFQACDIAAMTSWGEGMPNAVVEGAACGLPTVATAVGGIPQVIRHERSGLLVSPFDVNGIADALKRLLEDHIQRRRFGHEARAIALSQFNARENSRRLVALLDKTIRTYRDRHGSISGV